jgi:YVTN family beta-propeller protein
MGVFISYASQDEDAVQALATDLRRAHQMVWFGQELHGGDTWWPTILQQIQNADVFVFALSNHSQRSKPCRAELEYARALRIPVLPVQIGPLDGLRLAPIADLQIVDYRQRNADAALGLIAAVQDATLRRGPLPEPLPDQPPIPFEYLMRLGRAINAPQMNPSEQVGVLAQLRQELEDEDDANARRDIAMLLQNMRRRPDATYRSVSEIDALLTTIDQAPPTEPQPPRQPLPPTKKQPSHHLRWQTERQDATGTQVTRPTDLLGSWRRGRLSGKGLFSGRSVAFWTIIGSVATVLSLVVAVVAFLASTPRASGPDQPQNPPALPPARLPGSISLPNSPIGLAMAPDGRHAYVTYLSGTMSVIDTATNTVAATINVGGGALGVAVTPDGRHVYVAHWLVAMVSVVDTAVNTVTAAIKVNSVQWDVALTPDGRRAYVTNRGSGTVSVIDTVSNTVITTVKVAGDPVDNPVEVAVTPDGRRAYVTNRGSGTVSAIDTATNTVIATIPVQSGPNGVAVAPNGRYAYVTNEGSATVSVIETTTNTVTATISVGNAPITVAVAPDSRRAYVVNRGYKGLSVINTATNSVTTTVDLGGDPGVVVVTPDGRHVYVANGGTSTVSVIDTGT